MLYNLIVINFLNLNRIMAVNRQRLNLKTQSIAAILKLYLCNYRESYFSSRLLDKTLHIYLINF